MEDPFRERVTTHDGHVGGLLCIPAVIDPAAPLLICVHGGGCSGRYFDLKGASLVEAATRRGMPVLLVDRPGYGMSAPPAPGSPIRQGADAVRALLEMVGARWPGLARRGPAMIGHSIGGAVALTYAADRSNAPLTALCVSGIGDRPDADIITFLRERPAGATIEPPAHWFFGPEGSYGWRAVAALRAAAEPWRTDEVDEVICAWPARWPEITAAIPCPVQVRLAEFERIWEATPQAVARIAVAFGGAPVVDAAMAPDGGHLYEAHRRGAELIAAQLDFIAAQACPR